MDVDVKGLETNHLDINIDDNTKITSNCNSDDDVVDSKTINYFIDEKLWDKIGKELKDYDVNDMDMLRWNSVEDYIDFYYTYAKVKGFGVRKDTTLRSRKDGQIISKRLVCRAQGHRRSEWGDLHDRQRDPKPLTRFGCHAFIKFPCRHMFAVLKSFNAKELPRGCILRRWTIYAKEDIDMPKENEGVEHNDAAIVQARYSSLVSFCMKICLQASHETFHVFKDVRDEFMKISLKLEGRKKTFKRKSGNSKEYIGIGDPVVIETGRGQRKKVKTRASSSVSVNLSGGKKDQTLEKEVTPSPSSIDLNNSSISSPTNKFVKMDDATKFSTKSSPIMNYMPDTYKEGDLSKESHILELKNLEDPSVFDWKPYNEW